MEVATGRDEGIDENHYSRVTLVGLDFFFFFLVSRYSGLFRFLPVHMYCFYLSTSSTYLGDMRIYCSVALCSLLFALCFFFFCFFFHLCRIFCGWEAIAAEMAR